MVQGSSGTGRDRGYACPYFLKAVDIRHLKGLKGSLTLTIRAKYSPPRKFSVFKYRSRSSLAPTGLYLELNLSKRWKVCRPYEQETPVSSTTFLCSYHVSPGHYKTATLEMLSSPSLFPSLSLPPFL